MPDLTEILSEPNIYVISFRVDTRTDVVDRIGQYTFTRSIAVSEFTDLAYRHGYTEELQSTNDGPYIYRMLYNRKKHEALSTEGDEGSEKGSSSKSRWWPF